MVVCLNPHFSQTVAKAARLSAHHEVFQFDPCLLAGKPAGVEMTHLFLNGPLGQWSHQEQILANPATDTSLRRHTRSAAAPLKVTPASMEPSQTCSLPLALT
jgi:hypothetical protein